MSLQAKEPSPRAPLHRHLVKYAKVHPLPDQMDLDLGKGDASKPYITTKVDWTGGKQKTASNPNNNCSNNNNKLSFHLPQSRVTPFPETDAELAKGDNSTPYVTTKVDWTGGKNTPTSTASSTAFSLDYNKDQIPRESTSSTSSHDTSMAVQEYHQRSIESPFTLCPASSSLDINSTDQTQYPNSRRSIYFDNESPTVKREMAEHEVKKLEQACTDIKDALCEQNAAPGNMMDMQYKIQHLMAEEKLLKEKLSAAQSHTAKYTDIKNCIKFYKEEKRRITRGYSEDTLLGIRIPVEFETRQQKAKFLTSEIQTFRKEKKCLKKERNAIQTSTKK